MLEVYIAGTKQDSIPGRLIIDKKPAEFLWGVQYTRMASTEALPEKQNTARRIELVYQAPSKIPQLVSPHSLEELMPNGSVYAIPDSRFLLFASGFSYKDTLKAIDSYKTFFNVLNQKKLDGISDYQYMRIFDTINGLWNRLYARVNSVNRLYARVNSVKSRAARRKIILAYAGLFKCDPDVSHILEEVKTSR